MGDPAEEHSIIPSKSPKAELADDHSVVPSGNPKDESFVILRNPSRHGGYGWRACPASHSVFAARLTAQNGGVATLKGVISSRWALMDGEPLAKEDHNLLMKSEGSGVNPGVFTSVIFFFDSITCLKKDITSRQKHSQCQE